MLERLIRLTKRILSQVQYFEGNESSRRDLSLSMVHACGTEFHILSEAPSLLSYPRFDASRAVFGERLSRGDRLLLLSRGLGEVVTFGWITHREWMWVSEVGLAVRSRGRPVLYDFYTPSEHQRRGYHTVLLRMAFASLPPGKSGLIYALSSNTPPLRAYARIGLRRLSNLRMFLTGDISLRRTARLDHT